MLRKVFSRGWDVSMREYQTWKYSMWLKSGKSVIYSSGGEYKLMLPKVIGRLPSVNYAYPYLQ